MAVDVGERDWLDDADRAGVGDRGDQLGVAAGIHGPADQGDLDPRLPGEGGHPIRLSFQVARTRQTTSLTASVIEASTWCNTGSAPSAGTVTRASAIRVPRAFLRYSPPNVVTMPRPSAGSAIVIASPLASS